ncbi:MAG: Gfo/Idh/MocA family oxidoreductase [Acidobacteria bacterium]|nr:Gfo/Idh/MocA family oxidoreductase [Acidobacteriota bacterium]
MKNESDAITRRGFLKHSSLGAGLALSGAFAPSSALGANDRIRIGAIGTGGRCRKSLMTYSKNQPDTELVAVCDVYEPNLLAAVEIAPKAKQYRDYRALLDDQSIDAVLIGSPDHWHARMTMDAVRAGKDVYVEKPVTHSLEEGAGLVRVVEASKRVVQTGTQQRSWEHFIQGKQMVDAGKLGTVTFIRCWWYQNYAARRVSGNFKPDNLDRKAWLGSAPDQEVTPMKFFWWRWYWDFGGGALTDLMSHWIDVAHWYTGSPAPMSALTNGNRYILEWECPDTITCVLDYPKKFSVTYHGQMASSIDDGGMEIRGTKATMKLDRERLAIYPENGELIGKSGEGKPEILLRTGPDGTIAHIRNFLDCIRSRQAPTAGIRVAVDAARAAHLGNLSLRQERKIKWNASQERLES